jgi:heme-degrading monooxygenase HmoA
MEMKPEKRYTGTTKPDVFSPGNAAGNKTQRQMARVLVEYQSDDIEGLLNILIEARDQLFKFPGYVGGEHLINIKDHANMLVITTWQNSERWNAWAHSEACRKLAERVRAKLTKPAKVSIYNYFVIREKRVWSTF